MVCCAWSVKMKMCFIIHPLASHLARSVFIHMIKELVREGHSMVRSVNYKMGNKILNNNDKNEVSYNNFEFGMAFTLTWTVRSLSNQSVSHMQELPVSSDRQTAWRLWVSLCAIFISFGSRYSYMAVWNHIQPIVCQFTNTDQPENNKIATYARRSS